MSSRQFRTKKRHALPAALRRTFPKAAALASRRRDHGQDGLVKLTGSTKTGRSALRQQILNVAQRSGYLTYIITARRMISGELLKYFNGLLIARSYPRRPGGKIALTAPIMATSL